MMKRLQVTYKDDGTIVGVTEADSHKLIFTTYETKIAQRLVDCYNACLGVPTEDLKGLMDRGNIQDLLSALSVGEQRGLFLIVREICNARDKNVGGVRLTEIADIYGMSRSSIVNMLRKVSKYIQVEKNVLAIKSSIFETKVLALKPFASLDSDFDCIYEQSGTCDEPMYYDPTKVKKKGE